jgi:FtsP/CotA-like multicopper oxidase with cupredoxin domain
VPGDTFPDCFHGSSTANIHFHGTHTNSNGTGDNVLLEVRPSPRVNNQPTIGPDTYKAQFDTFFAACEQQLRGNALAEWPSNWYGPNDPQHPGGSSLGPWTQSGTWTNIQMSLLDASDQAKNTTVAESKPWPQGLVGGQWPQYYIGAYPYCFQLPNYPYASYPPPPGGIQMGQAPGTHWYHAHKHGSTAINVANGMTGVFIIEGASYDDALDNWYGDGWTRRQPVMVINQLGVSPNLLRAGPGQTDKGPDFSVNGRLQPVIDMKPGEVQLWRIANTSGRSGAFFLGPPPGFNWRQIAQDGVQFADANYQSSLNKPFTMASGNRVDLLVQAPTTPAIYPVIVQHEVDPSDLKSAYPVTLVSVRIKATDQPVGGNQSQFIPTAPTPPAFLEDIKVSEVQSTRTVNFASTGPGAQYGQHTINGKKFDGLANAEKVFLNTVEEWKITNATANPNISHPFHIHVNPFQVVEVFRPNDTVPNPDPKKPPLPKYIFYPSSNLAPGQCILNPNDPTSWHPCPPPPSPTPPPPAPPRVWWDVFPIPSGIVATGEDGKPILGPDNKQILVPGYFKMRSRFVDYPGYFVLHCHILAHEDRGMMTTVEVTLLKDKASTPAPYTHH